MHVIEHNTVMTPIIVDNAQTTGGENIELDSREYSQCYWGHCCQPHFELAARMLGSSVGGQGRMCPKACEEFGAENPADVAKEALFGESDYMDLVSLLKRV